MKKISEHTLVGGNKNTWGIKLKAKICQANARELANGHLPYILKLEDSILVEKVTKEEIKKEYVSVGDFDNYCFWHRLAPIPQGKILTGYRFKDSDEVIKKALAFAGYKENTDDYRYLYKFLTCYLDMKNPTSAETFKNLKGRVYMNELINAFSAKYFVH